MQKFVTFQNRFKGSFTNYIYKKRGVGSPEILSTFMGRKFKRRGICGQKKPKYCQRSLWTTPYSFASKPLLRGLIISFLRWTGSLQLQRMHSGFFQWFIFLRKNKVFEYRENWISFTRSSDKITNLQILFSLLLHIFFGSFNS